MKFKKEIFQILIALILTALLFTSFSWIIIHYQKPADSVKEALSIAVSFMGVLATIFAALIAVLLFNDWKVQHNKSIFSQEAKELLVLVNSDIKIHTDISAMIILLNDSTNSNSCLGMNEIIGKLNDTSDILLKISEKTLILFGLTKDDNLEQKRISYHIINTNLIQEIRRKIIDPNTKNSDIKKYYHSFMVQYITLNNNYKDYLRGFILA